MEVDVPLLDIKYCQQAYKREANVVIDNKVLCAGYLEGRLDSCQVIKNFHRKRLTANNYIVIDSRVIQEVH